MVALAGACVLAVALPALAAPKINASKTTGVKAGDTITVQVTGMSPNETFVTLGQCKPGPKLPNDCAAQGTGGAILGATDADGNFVTKDGSTDAKIKLVAEAGGADCAAKAGACVIAVTAPGNQGPNTAEIPLTFGGGGGGGCGGRQGGRPRYRLVPVVGQAVVAAAGVGVRGRVDAALRVDRVGERACAGEVAGA
ncbi:neocarzinostatin apoprotein domain-containing protein [Actinomadura sp. 6K520]|uniref:neocarzinostatin apoprotein domain-containing protein n=1 Tax=Actinomadura sp. 6K520 TaxID=2530364 RepID=UPI0032616B62